MLRKLHPILLLLPLLCVGAKLQLSAQQLLPNTWVPNGPVNAITRQGDIVYVGGAFTHVGLPIAQGAIFDRNSGEALPPAASLVEDVTHSISDGQGGFFLTTLYSHTPGLNYRSVVHLLANGRISETFNPVIPSTTNNVKVLAATNDRVIIRTQYGNPYVYALYCVGYDGS
ncbi:MAG: hypothetical protein O9262_12855, partial [Cyclobacteriaceae bacterium]|nr:hypothetical protein [Cyclobacteriaceae bacterium]